MSACRCGRLLLVRYLADDFSMLIGLEMPRFIIYRGPCTRCTEKWFPVEHR